MKMTVFSLSVFSSGLLAFVVMGGAASAQTFGGAAIGSTGEGYGAGGYGGGYHASTYEEGVLRGLASLRRATGEANYYNSLAAINRQEAISRYLENKEKKTEVYFRKQQINRAAREAERPQRLSHEQYVALAKKQAPSRLSEHQYDRTLGRLSWPAAFTGEEFTAERWALEALFARRSPTDTGAASAFHAEVRKLTSQMQNKLEARVSSMNPMEFIAARKFVTGLAYESQQPVAAVGLAAK